MSKPSLLARAAARAGAVVDRGALRMMERAMTGGRTSPGSQRPRDRLLALAAHYREHGEQLFAPPAPHDVREDGTGGVVELRFESGFRPTRPEYVEELASYAANRTARARLVRRPGDRPRPVAIWVHGWGGGPFWLEERIFGAAVWLDAGFDVCLMQLPFHGLRAPAQAPRSGSLFPGTNVVRTNEGFGQTIHDLRVLRRHLRACGAPEVGVVGLSLGAYAAALWATLDAELSFCAVLAPAVDLADLMWRHGEGSRLRRRAEVAGVRGDLLGDVFAVHAPTARPPRLPPERLAIVAGRGDRVCPPDQAERLRAHWGLAGIDWFAGGHLAQLGRRQALDTARTRILRGLAEA